MSNPVDALTKPRRRAPWIITGAAVVAIVAGSIVGGPTLSAALNPAPTPTAVYVEAAQTGSVNRAPYVTPEDETAAEQQAQAIRDAQAAAAAAAAQQAAQAAADQAAADAAQKANAAKRSSGSSDRNLPAGATPPNVPGTDQPDSTACASSALTWDGSRSVCA